jgi:hypothetical protein
VFKPERDGDDPIPRPSEQDPFGVSRSHRKEAGIILELKVD